MELEHGGRRYRLADGDLIVGSEPDCGIVLESLLARHAAVRLLGSRMATIRPLEEGAAIEVNGVPVGREPMPLMDGDVIRLGPHELHVRNPGHPAGGPDTPPPGARQRLHDTLFGVPKHSPTPPEGSPPVPPPTSAAPAPTTAATGISTPAAGSRRWILVAALVALLVILALLAL